MPVKNEKCGEMEQSLLLTLHERYVRALAGNIPVLYSLYDLHSGLSIADLLCEAAAVMLDDAISLSKNVDEKDSLIAFTIRVRDCDVVMDCSCWRWRETDDRNAASIFRLDAVQEIAERCGGRVEWHEWNDSVAVCAWLPYRKDAPTEKLVKIKILMIESDVIARIKNKTALTMEGYRVLDANNLEAGRGLLEEENPSLLILGHEFSGVKGYSFCQELREKSDIPILFAADCDSERSILSGFGPGFDESLSKSHFADAAFLASRVEYLLRRSERIDRHDGVRYDT